MAQKHVTIYIDDMTGAETVEGGTHTFAIDGVLYELDLSPESYDNMMDAFGPYVKAARRVRKAPRGAARVKGGGEGVSAAEMREWAKTQGIALNDRGRVPSEVRQAYEAAH